MPIRASCFLSYLGCLYFALGYACSQTPTPPTSSTRPIGLVDAVESALKKHPLLQIQGAQVDISRAVKQQASGRFDTFVDWVGNQSRINTPLTADQRLQAQQAGILTGNQGSNLTNYSLNAQKLTRSGISIGPVVELNRATDNLVRNTGINQSRVAFQVVLPLLRNRGRDAVTAQERAAEFGISASLYDFSHTASQLITSTAVAYWDYVAALKNLEVLRGSEARGQALVDTVRYLIDADQLPRNDINDVTANLADRTTNRVAAEQQVIQARQNLALAMGVGVDEIENVGLPTDDFPGSANDIPLSVTPSSLDYYIQQALARRGDYLSSRMQQRSSGALLVGAKNQLLPQLNLEISTGYSGLDEGRRPDRLLYSPFVGVQGADAVAGLRYSFPVQNNFARGQAAQAAAVLRQSELRQSETARNIASNVVVTAMAMNNSILRLQNASQTVAAFESALAGEREKLRLGVGSLVDILTIEDRLTTALSSLVQANLFRMSSLAQFRFATGTFLSPDAPVQNISKEVLFTLPFEGMPSQKGSTP